jgi:uncharacterized protein
MSNSASAIQTFTGIFLDPFDPDPEKIDITDIAHALANQCRFSGHTKRRWSVAHHSCLVSALCPDEFKLDGLLHDAHEAFCVDLPTPIKRHPSFAPYRDLERTVAAAVAERFGVTQSMLRIAAVSRFDRIALWAEAEELLHGTSEWTSLDTMSRDTSLLDIAHARLFIRDMLELDAETLFLKQFAVLTGKDVHA